MKKVFFSLLLTVLMGSAALADQTVVVEGIKITSAVWSGKSVTKEAGEFCDGKYSCDYKVSSDYIGEAKNPKNKSFRISWICHNGKPAKSLFKPHDAEDQILHLTCEYSEPVLPAVWNPRLPLRYAQSFHSLILSKESNPVKDITSTECVQAITKFLGKGRNFSSQKVLKYSLPMEKVPVAQVRDREFFHYTDSSEVRKIAINKKYSEIFKFLRTPGRSETSDWFLYAAADPESSSNYGHIRLTIRFRPHALMFMVIGDMPGKDVAGVEAVREQIEDEIIAKDKSLEACRYEGNQSNGYSLLMLLAAEASDVSAIAYYGINNEMSVGNINVQWVQVLDPWAIQSTSVNH